MRIIVAVDAHKGVAGSRVNANDFLNSRERVVVVFVYGLL